MMPERKTVAGDVERTLGNYRYDVAPGATADFLKTLPEVCRTANRDVLVSTAEQLARVLANNDGAIQTGRALAGLRRISGWLDRLLILCPDEEQAP